MHTLIGSTVVYCRYFCAIHWCSRRLNRCWVSRIAKESIGSAEKGHDRFWSYVRSPQYRIVLYLDSVLSLLAHFTFIYQVFPSLRRVKKLCESARTDFIGSWLHNNDSWGNLSILHGLDGCFIVNIMHKFGCIVVIIFIWFLHSLTSFFEFFSSEVIKQHTTHQNGWSQRRGGQSGRAEPAESQKTLWQGHPCRMGLQQVPPDPPRSSKTSVHKDRQLIRLSAIEPRRAIGPTTDGSFPSSHRAMPGHRATSRRQSYRAI